jgi:hypothetical protein
MYLGGNKCLNGMLQTATKSVERRRINWQKSLEEFYPLDHMSQGLQQARASCAKIYNVKRFKGINRAVLATCRRTLGRKTRECRRQITCPSVDTAFLEKKSITGRMLETRAAALSLRVRISTHGENAPRTCGAQLK